MNRLLTILLLTLSMPLMAAHPLRIPPRRIPKPLKSHRPLHIPTVSWQTIVAGGAAASGVVFAYKVADGIQSGMKEAARESPEKFLDKCGGVGGTAQIASAVIVIVGIAYLAWRLALRGKHPRRRQPPPSSDHEPPL